MTATVPRNRGRRNSNERGSSANRRARKQWLLDTYGDGVHAPCGECGTKVYWGTLHVDRYPVPGYLGGKYTRDNIRPHCPDCSRKQGAKLTNGKRQG